MVRLLAVLACAVVALQDRPALAAECHPYCDFTHHYGPADLTYVRPGLFGYPRCGPRGNCAPYQGYVYADPDVGRYAVFYPYPPRRAGRVTIRVPSRTKATYPKPRN